MKDNNNNNYNKIFPRPIAEFFIMTEPSPDILKCPSCNCKHRAKTDIFGNRIEMDGGTSDFDVREICKSLFVFLKVVLDVLNILVCFKHLPLYYLNPQSVSRLNVPSAERRNVQK